MQTPDHAAGGRAGSRAASGRSRPAAAGASCTARAAARSLSSQWRLAPPPRARGRCGGTCGWAVWGDAQVRCARTRRCRRGRGARCRGEAAQGEDPAHETGAVKRARRRTAEYVAHAEVSLGGAHNVLAVDRRAHLDGAHANGRRRLPRLRGYYAGHGKQGGGGPRAAGGHPAVGRI